ncbi:MAG: protein translocase subunit SecD [Marinobacter sp.]|uniref:protein translocase subunit SecD n=1 Tax=Marinobacter sp. TaxID=50741 RepID=UPI0034A03FCD
MKHFRSRALAYGAVILLGLTAALPSLLPVAITEQLPSAYADHKITLGLDLQGGSHLLLEVDTDALQSERLMKLGEEVVQRLQDAGINSSRVVAVDEGLSLKIRNAAQLAEARDMVQSVRNQQSPAWIDVKWTDLTLVLNPTQAFETALKDDAVERSLEVVRRRMDETGVVEPLISRQGDQGVLVQLPGVADPGRIKELLGRTARLTFHLVVDERVDTATVYLPDADGSRSYRVEKTPLLDGGDLTDAQLGFDQLTSEPVVHFRLNASGASRFADITRAHVGTPFAVVLDGEVVTAPVIRSPITGGSGEISGSFTVAEARDLSLLLRAGSLPAPLTVVEERTVGPDLGSDSIRMGVTTGLLGAALVLGFMVTVYGRWGMIANTALLINAGLIVGVLATFGATLTLPGMAGLILTIGMAVDANILINERIREESRKGASARYALQLGFQRAFSTILDSNITTLIAVGLLFLFGTGPVRGFAVAIAVGLVVSMFTSISVTRLLMESRVAKMGKAPLRLGRASWLDRGPDKAPINFMGVRARGLMLSVILSVASIGLLFQPGVEQGIDFKGGTLVEVHGDQSLSIETLRSGLEAEGLGKAEIQPFGGEGSFLLRTPVDGEAGSGAKLVEEIKSTVQSIDATADFPRVDVVGPSVSDHFIDTSILAVLLAGLGMFIYLWFRFERYFAAGAMLTLALDVTKTLGFFVLFGIEFNLTAVAALLALIGYSVNDKVVVFDRIRENLKLSPDKPLRELINESLTSTLTRTLYTSVTTFLAILPMGIAGGEAVASFALPMLFGIVVGTSSSIYIAAPLVLMFGERALRNAKEETQKREAAGEENLFLREDRP